MVERMVVVTAVLKADLMDAKMGLNWVWWSVGC
jgi:hypothetical protein